MVVVVVFRAGRFIICEVLELVAVVLSIVVVFVKDLVVLFVVLVVLGLANWNGCLSRGRSVDRVVVLS